MAVTPLRKIKKTIKRHKRFTRHEHEDYPGKLATSWRRPRGIDSRVRRQFRGNKPLVKIGYGTKRSHRHILPSGFKKLLVRCPADIEMLLMNNRVYAAEIAACIGQKKRNQILRRAKELNVRVINEGKTALKVKEREE